jgi:hypothetical protein
MTIGSLNRKPKPNFTYNNNLLENVNEFKFLGNVISQNGNFVSSSEALSKKALKVMYSIKSYMCSHDAVHCEPLIPASVDTCKAISFLQ